MLLFMYTLVHVMPDNELCVPFWALIISHSLIEENETILTKCLQKQTSNHQAAWMHPQTVC